MNHNVYIIGFFFFFCCQTLFKKLKMLILCWEREEKDKGARKGDDPLSVIIANEETGKLRAGENTRA